MAYGKGGNGGGGGRGDRARGPYFDKGRQESSTLGKVIDKQPLLAEEAGPFFKLDPAKRPEGGAK